MKTPAHLNRRTLLLGSGALSLSACATPAQKTFLTLQDSIDDPLARFRLNANAPRARWLEHLHLPALTHAPRMLALSGGGEDGAFGAGALAGLSKMNERHVYDIVTGVSTGALIAPFAFLGAAYDDTLRQIFLDHDASDIMRFNPVNALLEGGLFETDRLAGLIKDFTPASVLSAVAARHDQGARLFMVTTNIETSQAMVWNMGEIAKSGNFALFRTVMRASGTLPGLFTPVDVAFSANGKTYREVHVDGGVHMQFLATPRAAFRAPTSQLMRGGHAYVLINNTLTPPPEQASTSALGISQQAMSAMIRASAINGVETARLLAKRHGLGFSVASVSPNSGIIYDPLDRFSHDYMEAMYHHGFERARKGQLWQA
ncbi:patatin-like phospholipase family protein [Planktotalea sp.]|uniref:patatin-like phospholipase family protein n=1 Tax=Planktotalea sp. TaxID=2029877 RepID=UPI003298BC38